MPPGFAAPIRVGRGDRAAGGRGRRERHARRRRTGASGRIARLHRRARDRAGRGAALALAGAAVVAIQAERRAPRRGWHGGGLALGALLLSDALRHWADAVDGERSTPLLVLAGVAALAALRLAAIAGRARRGLVQPPLRVAGRPVGPSPWPATPAPLAERERRDRPHPRPRAARAAPAAGAARRLAAPDQVRRRARAPAAPRPHRLLPDHRHADEHGAACPRSSSRSSTSPS